MTEKIIDAQALEKIYGMGHATLKVLKGVDLTVNRGEIVSIMGPSGAGKSTLLNCIGCIDTFQKGSLEILGTDISNMTVEDLSSFRNNHIGFIFQMHNLLLEFNALENIMMPLLIRRVPRKKAKDSAMEMLERFNLTDRFDHKPSELSGGECQRIAVARSIVGKPDLILADEPTGSLDSENSHNLTQILLQLGKEMNTTIVIVTHDKGIASQTERTISLIDGRISDTGIKESEVSN